MPPASYLDITAVPYSRVVTVDEFNVASEQWFRYVAARELVLGFFVEQAGAFTPVAKVYESDATTLTRTVNGSVGFWTIVPAGETWIQVTKSGGGTTADAFRVRADTRPLDDDVPLQAGAIVVNDDAEGFAASILTIAGEILGFTRVVPAGEIGAVLPNAVSLWHDRYGLHAAAKTLALIDAQLHYVTSINIGLTTKFPVLATSTTDFYAGDRVNGKIYRITQAGVSTHVATISAASDLSAIGVNAAGTLLYWVDGYSHDTTIHRHDLVTDSPLSDLYTVPTSDTIAIAKTPNNHPGDLLVQPDGSIVTHYYNETADVYVLLHVSSTGTLRASYTYDPLDDDYAALDHLAWTGNSATVLVWWLRTPYLDGARFAELTLASGTRSGFTTAVFSESLNMVEQDPTMLGPSSSCTFIRLLTRAIIGPLAWIHWPRRVPLSGRLV